jgi:hypothetical protein
MVTSIMDQTAVARDRRRYEDLVMEKWACVAGAGQRESNPNPNPNPNPNWESDSTAAGALLPTTSWLRFDEEAKSSSVSIP